MKIFALSIFFFIVLGACTAQQTGEVVGIDDLRNELDTFLDQQISYVVQTFSYSMHNVEVIQTRKVGESAAYATDRKAGDHVLKSRSNYTTIIRGLLEIMSTTRDSVTNDILSKKILLLAKVPEIETVSNDLVEILMSRNCPTSSIAPFLSNLYQQLNDDIQNVVREASQTYSNTLMFNYIPIYLVDDFFWKVHYCLSAESNGLKCLLKNEDFYLSSSVNMVIESANRVAQFLINFNYRIAQGLSADVEHKLVHAYQTVYKYDCFNINL